MHGVAKNTTLGLLLKSVALSPDKDLLKNACFILFFKHLRKSFKPVSSGDRVPGQSATESHELAVRRLTEVGENMSDCGCGAEQAESLEKKTLIILLSINAFMFVTELTLGWLAQSTGLIADSLDMLADATVYGLSLYAVGKGVVKQAKAARVSGYLQIILGLGVLFEVIRRMVFGSEPQSTLIIVVGAVALLANII